VLIRHTREGTYRRFTITSDHVQDAELDLLRAAALN
jgi:hypothetical protein